MRQKKSKGKAGVGRRRKAVNDISPSTSLPPLVEGQLRCFLRLTVSKLVWMVAKPPASSLIRVRWWGETSGGTVFVPRNTLQAEQKNLKTSTCYPVRCGAKQFASYLTDMGALTLEVMTKSVHLPIGRVQISGLAQLSPSHPISGFFTIVSPTSEKMGELQVSLFLEPLSEMYENSSSIPNTDTIKETAGLSQFLAPSHLQRTPSTNNAGSVGSSRASTPRGKDHLYFQENPEHLKKSASGSQLHLTPRQTEVLSVNDPKQQRLFPNSADHDEQAKLVKGSPGPVRVLSCNGPATKDLLSALLDRGNRLRNAMAVSAMNSSPDHLIELNETQPSIKHDFSQPAGKSLKGRNPGLIAGLEDSLQPLPHCSEFNFRAEKKAVELLLGSSDFSPVRLVDGAGSPPESLSHGSDLYDSELNDPHYDQSLLENLFYTAPKSDSSLSEFLSDEEDAHGSGKLSLPKNSKSQRSPEASESSPWGHKRKALETKSSSSPTKLVPRETSMETTDDTMTVNLSLGRLATLGRIHVARVVVESLIRIPPEDVNQSTLSKKSSTGKPPRPTLAKKRTFFVEFHFPVRASKNGIGQVAVTTEIVRVASSKCSGEGVKFQQRSVFPIHFSGPMLTHWWKSDLEFNIFLKKGTQRKPQLIGMAAFPLQDVLRSEELTVSRELPVKGDGVSAQLGPLKVLIELAGDNKDISSTKATSAEVQAPVGPVRSHSITFQDAGKRPSSTESPQPSKQSNHQAAAGTGDLLSAAFERVPEGGAQPPGPLPVSRSLLTQMNAFEEGSLLLYVFLMVSEGQIVLPPNLGLDGSCNVYLVCKLFSTEEATKSAVVWGSRQPTFHFSQVTPVSLTSRHLERLKNNVMVIEAWNKVLSPGGDRLLGLVKLPLHQFYISFKDPRISSLLLQAQYPVLAVDGAMPIMDVFTGQKNGSLNVLLAMGSADQVVALQRLKKEEERAPPVVLHPLLPQDPLMAPSPKLTSRETEGLIEHTFEIHIEGVTGLMPLQSTVWGEADCYVQYHFPVQKSDSGMLYGEELSERGLELKAFRTSTTLCVPDPTFKDKHGHSLVVPADTPVQRLLLSAFTAKGSAAAAGGIHFEIWCRYYYPNVRDQVVARGTLPLSRLCAMVTMQHQQDVGIQTFHLPVIPRIESSGELHPRTSGFLEVSVKYWHSLKISEGLLATQMVPISVQIHLAAGLQAAARAVAEKYPFFQYNAEIGVNAYVSVHVPFLPEVEKRQTRTVARSFCPEFEHYLEFPCNLVVQRGNGEVCCLGELLQLSEIVFHIYHKHLNSAPSGTKTQPLRDRLLGTVRVPTRDLLIRRSGIRGWYPVNLPEDLLPASCVNVMQNIVGGLEVSVAFAHPGDRERVLEPANLLGWNWKEALDDHLQGDSESECQSPPSPVLVTFSIPRLWLPVQCMLLAGQTRVNKSIYCYLRYKLYDQEATWTSLRRPKLAEDGKHVTVTFKKPQQMELPWSRALLWYFREEKLELQVWRAYGKDSIMDRPLDTDRLIGSAYVDLAPLADCSRKKKTISGVAPLFRRNAANLWGAVVRVHIVVTPIGPCRSAPTEEGSGGSSNDDEGRKGPGQGLEVPLVPSPSVAEILGERSSVVLHPEEDLEKTFAVSILVERAMHLSLKGSPLAERGVASPSSYVSFVATDANNPISTEIVEGTDSPVWDFQQQTRLSKELLLDSQKTLVFKVWHKADVERVIGFASVDLSPLLSGFQVVCGWYNLTDFSGQCRGQIKVAVSPLENIMHLKEERQARSRQIKKPGSSMPTSSAFQARDVYSSFSTRGSPRLPNSPLKGTDVPGHESKTGSRYKEHVQNIRRFHTSLQQAEDGSLDSLPLSSSLFRALRKNLNELDEIQRYFSQKLTRPFPDLDAPSTVGDLDTQNPSSKAVDPERRRLLEKPGRLVSQVGSLSTDLQNNIMHNPRESLGGQGDGSRVPHANEALPEQEDGAGTPETLRDPLNNELLNATIDEEPPFPPGKAFPARGMLYEFLGPTSSQRLPSHTPCVQREENTAQSHSEGEYEEDIIEPRTLNEITTVTDRTSPWSSLISDAEQEPEPEDRAAKNAGHSPKERSSSVSSVTQDDPLNLLSTTRSSSSPLREDEEGQAKERLEGPEGGPEELFPSAAISAAEQAKVRPTETHRAGQKGALETQEERPDKAPSTFPGGVAVAAPLSVAPEVGGREDLHGHPQRGGGIHFKDEGRQQRPGPQAEPWSGESDGDLLGESGTPPQPVLTLSEPTLVPNFFLPPRHLEVSMRLLSASSSLLAAARKPGKSINDAGEISHQRQTQTKPSAMPALLPEEEMKRIARIFSTQFSKKS